MSARQESEPEVTSTFAPVAVSGVLFVVGTLFGATATAGVLTPAEAVGMSALTFVGSSQFAAVSALSTGASAWGAILTAAALNLRYIALGAAAAPFLTGRWLRRAAVSQLVIEETWALSLSRAGALDERRLIRTGITLYLSWVIGTFVGTVLRPDADIIARFGLDVVIPALFTVLSVSFLRTAGVLVAAVSAAVSLVVALVLSPAWAVPCALLVAAAFELDRNRRKKRT